MADGPVVPVKPRNGDGGKAPCFRTNARKRQEPQGLTMSLPTLRDSVEKPQMGVSAVRRVACLRGRLSPVGAYAGIGDESQRLGQIIWLRFQVDPVILHRALHPDPEVQGRQGGGQALGFDSNSSQPARDRLPSLRSIGRSDTYHRMCE